METIGVEAGIPLEGHFDLLPVLDAFDVADLGKQGLLGGIHVGHEVADAPLVLVVHLVVALVRPFVSQSDPQTPVQERHHLEALGQGLKTESSLVEDRHVRPEANGGAGPSIG